MPPDLQMEEDFDSLDRDLAELRLTQKIAMIAAQLAEDRKNLGFDFPTYDVLRQRAERASISLQTLEQRLDRYQIAIKRLRNTMRALRHTERAQAQHIDTGKNELIQAMHQSLHDELTELPNRRFFAAHFDVSHAHSAQTGEHGALLFIDLDKFKPVNDIYGHQVGDQLLIEVASRLLLNVREIDTVFRFGGDEFAVTLAQLPKARADAILIAQRVANNIKSTLALTYHLTHPASAKNPVGETLPLDCHVTASIGVVVFNGQEKDISQLLRQADDLMYAVKRKGGDGVQSLGDVMEPDIC